MFSGLDLCCADHAQHLTTAGCDQDYLDRDLSDLSDVCILAKVRTYCVVVVLLGVLTALTRAAAHYTLQ